MTNNKYIDDAVISEAPKSLMESVGPMVEEVGINHKLVRPKRPDKIASSAAKFRSYEILKDLTTDAGRHFLFEQVLIDSGYPIQHIVNIEPYNGQAWEHPGDFYYMLKKKGYTMRRAGRSTPDYALARELTGHEEPPKQPEPPPEPEETQGFLFDMSRHPDSDDWNRASTSEVIKEADSVWTQSQVYCEDGVCYDIEKIIDETRTNSIERARVSELRDHLFENAWGDDMVHVSPMGVMNAPLLNVDHKTHMSRIRTADMSFPILIRFEDGTLMDGYHRLSRALLDGLDRIDAIYVQEEQVEKAEIKS